MTGFVLQVTYKVARPKCSRDSGLDVIEFLLFFSSVEELQASAHMSRSRAEDVYRCLRYSCDSALMTNQL